MFSFGKKILCNFFYYISQISLVFAMEKSELSYCGIKFEVKKNGYSDINYILILLSVNGDTPKNDAICFFGAKLNA